MKVEQFVMSLVEKELDFSGLTLLSEEEFIRLKTRIPYMDSWWWLRTGGNLYFIERCVTSDENINIKYVGCTNGCIRPALILESPIDIGAKFRFYGHTWTVISNQYALCDDSFGEMAFCCDPQKVVQNDYDTSDVKKYLDCEWEKMKNEN